MSGKTKTKQRNGAVIGAQIPTDLLILLRAKARREAGRDELKCFNRVKRGTCGNTRKIGRLELEGRVLTALRDRFLSDPVAFDTFTAAFVAETNRLHAEQAAARRAAPRELAAINRRSKEILELLLSGFRDESWKIDLAQGEQRRRELEAEITATADAAPVPPALHPRMATIYRAKVEALAAALDHDDADQRGTARETMRGFIAAIVIPAEGLLKVRGALGKMLAAAAGETSPLATAAQSGCGGGI